MQTSASSGNSVDISFFIACYNKAPHIVNALETVRSIVNGKDMTYEMIVVDDGSTDNSQAVIQEYCMSHEGLPIRFHLNSRNKGLGHNYVYWASQAHGKYFMLVNGDNDIPAEDFSVIVEQRGKADIIVPY